MSGQFCNLVLAFSLSCRSFPDVDGYIARMQTKVALDSNLIFCVFPMHGYNLCVCQMKVWPFIKHSKAFVVGNCDLTDIQLKA